MTRSLVAAFVAVVTMLGLTVAAVPAAAAPVQTLTWTADSNVTRYTAAPTEALPGETLIVFENSVATGNNSSMPHTLTFDTATEGYNHDVTLDILANPNDANGGKHEETVTLTPGKYRYYCAIPGHLQMTGEFTVSEGGEPGEDTTAPSITAAATGDEDADGNFVGAATITVNATDDQSGVDTVEYQLDGGEWTAYTEPIVVDEVGAHMLHYRATDKAGNASDEGMLSFTVVEGQGEDTAPPTVTAAAEGEQDADGNYLDSASVTLNATDEQSGVDTIEYKLDDGAWTPYTAPVVVDEVGMRMLHYRATDKAGNTSEEGMLHLNIVEGPDDEGPTVTATVTGDQNANWEYLGRARLSLAATDEKSEIDVLEYALDGGDWTSYSRPVNVTKLGKHTVRYRAFDSAGNPSEQYTGTFTIVSANSTKAKHQKVTRVL